ncbi:V-type ATP synthase subunit E family protein [Streptomyces sp. NPDC057616]|uniref:V-type ATP synthase subunit E family protein n=1 Tax=Streptomyces sp. NPDC057616 TaxID=3346183 RepID=UPI003687EA5E
MRTTLLPAAASPALDPVRARLLRDAAADAEALLAEADEEARAGVREAEAQASAVLAEARRQGAHDADLAGAAARSRVRRAARSRELAARREIWEDLCRQVVDRVEALRGTDAYPAVRRRLTARVRQVLGPGARITEAPGGGVVGDAPGRRLDCGLAAFAQRALDRAGGEVEQLWAP